MEKNHLFITLGALSIELRHIIGNSGYVTFRPVKQNCGTSSCQNLFLFST